MAEQKDATRRSSDPIEQEGHNAGKVADGGLEEPNTAQRQSDATNDATALAGVEEPTPGTMSNANGLSAADDVEGQRRRKQYEAGAELVSRLD